VQAAPTLDLHWDRNPLSYNCNVRILISAGEASGEMYGAQLIESLRRATAHVGTDALVRPAEQSSAGFLGRRRSLTVFLQAGLRAAF